MEAESQFIKTTPDKVEKETKTFIIQSDKNKKYTVLMENTGAILNFSTELIDPKSLKKTIYKNKFTLIDIQKVKLFLSYDSIKECLSEIETKKGIIKEGNNKLDLIFPLNSKKYPQITFPLLLKEISDSEKIEELYGMIHELNKEKNQLKNKIEVL